ncbi:MAG: hypothetical protein KY439_07525 [Actinobacteria bacterium]|nr:hypothetical protein [Actinomycetota bacterium]
MALAALVMATAGACKVDASVEVSARPDGTGEVTVTALLDRRAVDTVGDLDTQVALDDLRATGWEVRGPEENTDGGAEVEARRSFGNSSEARQVLDEITGPEGAFKGFVLEQKRTFFRTETAVRGTVDLSGGMGTFSDAKLAEALGGQPLGVTAEQLEQRLGVPADRAFGLQVAVRLPGRIESNAPTTTGSTAVWAPGLGEQVAIMATAEQWNRLNLVLTAVAAGSALALVGVLARRRRSPQ